MALFIFRRNTAISAPVVKRCLKRARPFFISAGGVRFNQAEGDLPMGASTFSTLLSICVTLP